MIQVVSYHYGGGLLSSYSWFACFPKTEVTLRGSSLIGSQLISVERTAWGLFVYAVSGLP